MTEKGRVLIMDDEEVFLYAYAALLRKEGYRCDCARDASAGFEQIKSIEFDVLIADILMPGNEELQMIKRLSAENRKLPIILVTGHPTLETAIKAIPTTVIGYLLKPVDFDELLEMTRTAVQYSRTQRSIETTRKRMEISLEDMHKLGESAGVPKAMGLSTSVESYFRVTQQNFFRAMNDLMQVMQTLSGKAPDREVCHLMNCPRLGAYRYLLQETIDELEKSKNSFKSKHLEVLRKKITETLNEERINDSAGSL